MEMFTEEEMESILWDDHNDFNSVTNKVIDDQGRWALYFSQVFQQNSTGDYYRITWSEGATEYQEIDLDPTIMQVYPKEIKSVIYTTSVKD